MISIDEVKKINKELNGKQDDPDFLYRLALALEYYPELKVKEKPISLLEKAYKISKTLEISSDLARILYYDYGETKRAIEILRSLLIKEQNSFIPYSLLGYILLCEEQYEDSVSYLKKAYEIDNDPDILNNLGNAYFYINDFEKAIECFKKTSKQIETEKFAFFNLAVCYYKNNDIELCYKILSDLDELNKINSDDGFCPYEVANLYYALSDYPKAFASAKVGGLKGIDLTDWDGIGYSIYLTDVEILEKELKKEILETEDYIKRFEANEPMVGSFSVEENRARIPEFKEMIRRKATLIDGFKKTKPEAKVCTHMAHIRCLQFECTRHDHPYVDI